MKKIFLSLLVVIFAAPLFVSANVEEDVWSYIFHLEYTNSVLKVNQDAAKAYSPVPVAYEEKTASSVGDFYGVIFNLKGKEEARFGFNRPTTQTEATGRGLLSVRAPYFADADHVTFYAKAGQKLFDVSVKKSSFCNDDNKCNADVGENHLNCPSDCAADAPIVPQTMPIYLVATTSEASTTEILPIAETEPSPASPDESVVVKKPVAIPQITFSPIIIMILVGSGGILLLLIILWKIKKNMD